MRAVPLVRRGNRFEPHHMEIGPRSLIQIGSSADSAPGVELWEVPAPAGATRLLIPPADPFAPCGQWRASLGRPDGAGDRAPAASDGDAVCVLPFAAPFALEVRRLLPDTGGLATRSLWAAAMLMLPALGWLLWLAAERRSRLTRARLADALAASWIALVLAGISAWRLLWAHRIDMLRDHEAFGWRAVQNQVLVVLIAAALAATCASRAEPGAGARRRLVLSLAAWAAIFLLGLFALGPDRAALLGDRAIAGALLSLVLGAAPVAGPLLLRRLRAAAAATTAPATTAASGAPARLDLRLLPLAALVAAAAAAAMAAVAAPREPSVKLALAWSIALLFHAALGTAVQPDRLHRRRLYAVAGAGVAAALAALSLDPGIATAIVLPGLVFALLFAAHDASFDDRAMRQLGSYRQRHAPLAACHAALVTAVAAAAAIWAVAGLLGGGRGGEPGRTLTEAGFHLPLLVAGFLAPAAILVARRRGRVAAWPWVAAAAAAALVWLARDPLLDMVMASDSQAASRIALVSDPGYALLRNPDRFLAGLTAWRETALPAAAGAWTGQGYFGAQLLDPGVLLSVENDYLALLILRESGAAGLLAPALLLVGAAAGLFLLAGDRFRRGGAPERRRALAALLLGVLAVYQPLAALGALPLTGLPWPGLGIDSPSDLWLLTALLLFVALWGRADDAELDAYDADLRRERRYVRLRRAEQAAAMLLLAAAVLVLARAAVGAASRPGALAGTTAALDYARGLACADSDGASVPDDIVGQPTDPAGERFHAALRFRWQHGALARGRADRAPGRRPARRGALRRRRRRPVARRARRRARRVPPAARGRAARGRAARVAPGGRAGARCLLGRPVRRDPAPPAPADRAPARGGPRPPGQPRHGRRRARCRRACVGQQRRAPSPRRRAGQPGRRPPRAGLRRPRRARQRRRRARGRRRALASSWRRTRRWATSCCWSATPGRAPRGRRPRSPARPRRSTAWRLSSSAATPALPAACGCSARAPAGPAPPMRSPPSIRSWPTTPPPPPARLAAATRTGASCPRSAGSTASSAGARSASTDGCASPSTS